VIDFLGTAKEILDIVSHMHELRQPRVLPTQAALSKVLQDVFWSSLDQYEGNPVRARVFFAPRAALENSERVIQLATRQRVSTQTLRQLAPAHALDGALLAVEDDSEGLHIEGILGSLPFVRGASPLWLCVECRGPGSVRVSIGSQPILEYTRGVTKQLGGMSFDRTAAEVLLMGAGLFPIEPPGLEWHISSALLDIGRTIEQYGGGGAIWILPAGTAMSGHLEGLGNRVGMHSVWWEPYREMWEMRTSTIRLLNPGCDQGHEFLQRAAQEWDFLRQDALTKSVATLPRVDGAIVINGSPEVLAFGVICNTFESATEVLRATDPSRPTTGEVVDVSVFGGSRHRSAIDFCSSHSPAGALVASHDGGLTVFASMKEGRVIGSRVSLIPSAANVPRIGAR
jgi:sensor domain DACNV-containing protein